MEISALPLDVVNGTNSDLKRRLTVLESNKPMSAYWKGKQNGP